jgi:hypothetical protein
MSVAGVMLLGVAPAQADYGSGPPPTTTTTVLVLGSSFAPSVSTTVAPTTTAAPTTTTTAAPAVLGQTIAPSVAPVKAGLAFTGADIAGLVVIALVLIVLGFGLRTAGRRRHLS